MREKKVGAYTSHVVESDDIVAILGDVTSHAELLEAAGFVNSSTKDRNEFLIRILRADYSLITGEGREELIRRTGEEAQHYTDVWHAALRAAEVGELRPGHLRGFKP